MKKIAIIVFIIGSFTACSSTKVNTYAYPSSAENQDIDNKELEEANILNNKGVDAYKSGDYKR